MNTGEQMVAMGVALGLAGWRRVSGNRWQSPSEWTLHTSYTYKEATLTLCRWAHGHVTWHANYRGPDPLGWLGVIAQHLHDKNLATELAKQLDTESVPV